MNDVIFMICFSGSGGTLLNRMLGSLKDVVMLSEVNPLGGGASWGGSKKFSDVKSQALHWYGIELESNEYADQIDELATKTNKDKKILIVRDWPFINFIPCKKNEFQPV